MVVTIQGQVKTTETKPDCRQLEQEKSLKNKLAAKTNKQTKTKKQSRPSRSFDKIIN